MNVVIRVEALDATERPEACIGCGQCSTACPQSIDVPAVMRDFSKRLAELPSWDEICRRREAAANAEKNG